MAFALSLTLLCALVISGLIFADTSFAQTKYQRKYAIQPLSENSLAPLPQDESIYGSIAQSLRQDLVKGLNRFLTFRREERWDSLYELMSQRDIRGRTIGQFVADYAKYPGVAATGRKLVDFSPKAITPNSGQRGGWIIAGCARLTGVRFPVDAFVLTTREDNRWRFSDVDMATPRDSPFVPCGYLAQTAQ